MYDSVLSEFAIPSEASSVTTMVCNGAIYAVGMWIQFTGPYAKLQISAITGNTLTLLNRNANGETVGGNPAIGTRVYKDTQFVVCAGPSDMSDDETAEQFQKFLDSATQLCMPNLGPSSSTAVMHPVGRLESDPNNLSAKKCLRRIYGILFKAGRPFLSALGVPVDINDMTNFRPLVRHKTNGGVHQRKNYSEASGLANGKQYALAVTNTSEKLLQTYFTKIAVNSLEEDPNHSNDPDSWEVMTDEYTKTYDISDTPNIMPPEDHNLDHYYVMVDLEIAGSKTSGSITVMRALLNDVPVARCVVSGDADVLNFNSGTKLIKVMKSNNELKLKIISPGSVRRWYRLVVQAVLY